MLELPITCDECGKVLEGKRTIPITCYFDETQEREGVTWLCDTCWCNNFDYEDYVPAESD